MALFCISGLLDCAIIEAPLFRIETSFVTEFAEDRRDANDNEEPLLPALMGDPSPIVCFEKAAPSLNGMCGNDDDKFIWPHTLTNVPMHMIMQISLTTTIFTFSSNTKLIHYLFS